MHRRCRRRRDTRGEYENGRLSSSARAPGTEAREEDGKIDSTYYLENATDRHDDDDDDAFGVVAH